MYCTVVTCTWTNGSVHTLLVACTLTNGSVQTLLVTCIGTNGSVLYCSDMYLD